MDFKRQTLDKYPIEIVIDGNMFNARRSNFINLQESVSGFGETRPEARIDLIKNEIMNDFKERWEDDTTCGGYYNELLSYLIDSLAKYEGICNTN